MNTAPKYVCGFLIDRKRGEVVLVRKKRPAWQVGLWNGVGGHIEEGETPLAAMIREFQEEAGAEAEWEQFATLGDMRGYRVAFFRAFASDLRNLVRTATDEEIVVANIADDARCFIPNLTWLIPMALAMDRDRAAQFDIREIGDDA